MNKKKKQMCILLGVLFLLLLIWYVVYAFNQKQEEKQEAEEKAAVIYATDLKEICMMQFHTGSEEFLFEKKDGVWIDRQDPDFPLKQSIPEEITLVYEKLKAERELKDGDEPEEYGLSNPAYTIELTDTEGDKVRLSFGNTTGDNYYMRNENTGTIYTVSSASVQELQHTREDLAQLDTYPGISSGNLKKVEITQNGETAVYDSENEDDSYQIASAAGGLGAVSLGAVADYSAEDQDLAQYGLDEKTRTTVEATYTQDEEEKVLCLYLGKEDGEGNRYVMLNDSKIIYLISTEICGNMIPD